MVCFWRRSTRNTTLFCILIALAYIPVCVAFAWLNAKWIKEGKRIKHGWNGLLHCSVACLVGWATWKYNLKGEWWAVGLSVLLIARAVFDTSLNLFRQLPVDYYSPEIKQYTGLRMAIQKGKVIDYLEYKAFLGNGYIPKALYTLAVAFLLSL